MMHLRQPIQLPKGRELRVLIHARFSTEEQRQSSIDDQITACRAFLDTSMPKVTKPSQVTVDVIKEPEISGEIADRPGINQVWDGIESKRWDLIIAEESSRLYRHHTKAGELFESAVDAGVRVICPSDYIDTADDDWPDRLHMCQMQHSRSNFYTRQRIRRAHDGLRARGAAVGNTVIGYKRRCTVPATETEPAKGPFYDEIDPEKAPIIREVFERIAAGETSAEVGEWLDSIKFAKAKWSRQAKWTPGNVNAIIRWTIYRGFETNRKKVAKRKLRTGKSEYVWNDDDKIQARESPHLRIVSDHLWYQANEVVDKRRVFQKPVRRAGHPLRGTTRQRRGLLSGVFTCGICGAPMYSYGKMNGSYRCSGSAMGKCWNRVYCLRERTDRGREGAVARRRGPGGGDPAAIARWADPRGAVHADRRQAGRAAVGVHAQPRGGATVGRCGPAPPGGTGGRRFAGWRARGDAPANARGQCVRRAAVGEARLRDRAATTGRENLQGDRQGTRSHEGQHAQLRPDHEVDGGGRQTPPGVIARSACLCSSRQGRCLRMPPLPAFKHHGPHSAVYTARPYT